jgi:hypothetical protein
MQLILSEESGPFSRDTVETIAPQEFNTNSSISIPRSSEFWWLDGIEIPEDKEWDEIEDIRIGFNDTYSICMNMELLFVMTKQDRRERFFRIPWDNICKGYIPLVRMFFIETRVTINTKSCFPVILYQGRQVANNRRRRELASNPYNLQHISHTWDRFYKGEIVYVNPNTKNAGIFIRSSDPLRQITITRVKDNITMHLDEVDVKKAMIQEGWQYTEPYKHKMREIFERHHMPETVYGELEAVIREEEKKGERWSWWWIPFQEGGSFWDWEQYKEIGRVEISLYPKPTDARCYCMEKKELSF